MRLCHDEQTCSICGRENDASATMCDRQKAYNNSKPIHKYHYGAEKNFVHANVCKIFFLARDTDTFRSLRIIIISEVFSFFEPHSRPPYILKKCTIDDSLPADQVVEHQAELVDKRSKITCTLENRTKTKQVVYLTPQGYIRRSRVPLYMRGDEKKDCVSARG